ncbi:MAG: hypothetical protein ACKVX7_00945 [Planctomycetota bacterium]
MKQELAIPSTWKPLEIGDFLEAAWKRFTPPTVQAPVHPFLNDNDARIFFSFAADLEQRYCVEKWLSA